jgi:hypothetical protein
MYASTNVHIYKKQKTKNKNKKNMTTAHKCDFGMFRAYTFKNTVLRRIFRPNRGELKEGGKNT